MQSHITICCLLVTFNNVFFASSTKVESNPEDFFSKNATKNDRLTDEDRWKLETADFTKGLKMANDKGELVELTTDVTPPRGSASRGIGETVSFHLYTRRNRRRSQEIIIDYRSDGILRKSNLNPNSHKVFITHGWISNGNSSSCTLIRDAYLRMANVNVIVVDWGETAFASYQWGARNVRSVAQQIAKMIDYMESIKALDPKETTLVGHSLGAHVMGVAAYNARGKIKNVFGLDPAYPMFKYAGPGSRISIEDAEHVQIIHTNAGSLGYYEPIGRSDFYPNGGSAQLGCGADLMFVCSHSRAVEIFAESLTTKVGFYGKPCTSPADFLHGTCRGPNIAIMGGFKIEPTLQGIFYLRTNEQSPYALGKDG